MVAETADLPLVGDTRPNIVLIVTDQQRSSAMSCAGNTHLQTPAMDSLAARGTRFARAYATYPLCTPSRASLATSRMPYELGISINDQRLPAAYYSNPVDYPSLGTLFQSAGYRTVWAGRWHVPTTYPAHSPNASGEIPGFELLAFAKVLPGESIWEGKGSSYDGEVAAAAAEFIHTQVGQQQPFLLSVQFLNPHDIINFTVDTPKDPAELIPTVRLPALPNNLSAPDMGAWGKRVTVQYGLNWNNPTFRQMLYVYYRLTEVVDNEVGVVLQALRDANLEDNTVILYTSDHGEMGGSHRRFGKQSLYQEATMVPFILAGPGVPAGGLDRHLVSGLDVLPTLCDFAGIPLHPSLRGMSVKPLFTDANAPWRDAVYSVTSTNQRMVRTAQYKYLRVSKINALETKDALYDLWNDPGEQTNLAAVPEMQAVLNNHRILLYRWLLDTGDRFVNPAAGDAADLEFINIVNQLLGAN